EGWMPQSEEHLVILELLGVRHGVVALTNADAVDEDTLDVARAQVGERLARSSWREGAIVACDSVTRRGLDARRRRPGAAPPPCAAPSTTPSRRHRPSQTSTDRGCGSIASSPPAVPAWWSPGRL